MLLVKEEGIREGAWHAFHWYAKSNNKYIKPYDDYKKTIKFYD